MNHPKITLRAESAALEKAIADLDGLLSRPDSELDVDCFGQFRKLLRNLFAESVLDISKLVRVDSLPAADGTCDMFVSLQPSDLFLELLSALRTGDRDGL